MRPHQVNKPQSDTTSTADDGRPDREQGAEASQGLRPRLEAELAGLQQLVDELEPSAAARRRAEDPPRVLGPVAREEATIIFVDLEAHTELVCGSEADVVISTLNRVFSLLAESCMRYDVTVNQYLGDGMMAFVRGPDHARRGVRAALEWHQCMATLNRARRARADRELQLRIGISSGPVVLGNLGTPQKMDFTAVGPATNLAARLQAAAASSSVCISGETRRQLGTGFVISPPRRTLLKGFGPQWVWDVIAVQPQTE